MVKFNFFELKVGDKLTDKVNIGGKDLGCTYEVIEVIEPTHIDFRSFKTKIVEIFDVNNTSQHVGDIVLFNFGPCCQYSHLIKL